MLRHDDGFLMQHQRRDPADMLERGGVVLGFDGLESRYPSVFLMKQGQHNLHRLQSGLLVPVHQAAPNKAAIAASISARLPTLNHPDSSIVISRSRNS